MSSTPSRRLSRKWKKWGGWTAKHNRYTQISEQILQSLQKLGITTLLDETDYSCVLTSFKIPSGYSYAHIHDTLKESGFIIYAGQGELKKETFRIANMGDIQPKDLDKLLYCFQTLFENVRNNKQSSALLNE